ncbi:MULTISPECIES: hypothetical protein [unclassified Exiguobacterium]|uniref:hypothetical protein n=1 Tax=unclassified Exiguobacterium TaxID=2644629 RepID=UPI0025BD657A|nr:MULTISPECIES: hypothetical protein [unclassified Exiguobacterium]
MTRRTTTSISGNESSRQLQVKRTKSFVFVRRKTLTHSSIMSRIRRLMLSSMQCRRLKNMTIVRKAFAFS